MPSVCVLWYAWSMYVSCKVEPVMYFVSGAPVFVSGAPCPHTLLYLHCLVTWVAYVPLGHQAPLCPLAGPSAQTLQDKSIHVKTVTKVTKHFRVLCPLFVERVP